MESYNTFLYDFLKYEVEGEEYKVCFYNKKVSEQERKKMILTKGKDYRKDKSGRKMVSRLLLKFSCGVQSVKDKEKKKKKNVCVISQREKKKAKFDT